MTQSNIRLTPLKPPYAKAIQANFDSIMPDGMPPLNIFSTIAHNPRVLNRFMAGGLLDKGSIGIRQRELVILRSCAVCNAEYEWGVHAAIYAAKGKLSEEAVQATRLDKTPSSIWNEEELSILNLVDELHNTAQISNKLWSQLDATFDADQIIELIMLCGFYHTVSFLVNGLKVENEVFAPGFPAG